MEVTKLTFQADEQNLVKTSGTDVFASDTVSYIEADFTLGENWTGYDSVRAMWKFGSDVYATVLDSDGKCIVPHEVLTKRGELKVNLVGSISENGVLTDRLTTFPILALVISKIAQVEGDNSTAPTASEYEQFVENVHEDAERAVQAKTDAESARDLAQTYADNAEDSATASADSATSASQSATQAQESASASAQSAQSASQSAQSASQSATSASGSAQSAQTSAQNAQESAESASDSATSAQESAERAEQAEQSILGLEATASVDNTVGTPSVEVTVSEVGGNKVMDFDFHNLKGEQGIQGETGNGIAGVAKTGTSGNVDTYTITFTDGTTTTFTVTNGSVTSVDQQTGDVEAISIIKITNQSITLGEINAILNTGASAINVLGRHVMFDVSVLGTMMYLCTIFIDTDAGVYKIFDLVKGRTAEGSYNADMLFTMASAMASDLATQSQIDYLQSEIDELGGKSVLANWDALGDMILNGTSTDVISNGDIIPVNWIKTVLGTTAHGLTVTCSDMDKFINGVGEAEAKTYLLVYDGTNWTYDGETISLTDFGLSVSGTPVTGEVMTIVTTVDAVDYTFTSYDTVEPVDNTVTHNWLLEQTYAPSTKAYDTYESLFCLKEGKTLSAGKYYLPMRSYRSSNKIFNACFELASSISGKVQFARTASGSQNTVDNTGATISGVYAVTQIRPLAFGTATYVDSAIAVTYLSDADVVSGGYTQLSTDDVVYGNLDCSALGDNTWAYSNIRQWLNDDTQSDNFVPLHDNDIASAYNRQTGFLFGIDPRVKNLIQTAKVLWMAGYGNVDDFTQNQTYTSQDKVFLLSMKEMSFNLNVNEGDATGLYSEYTNNTLTNDAVASRAKYNKAGGTLNNYRWSRSANVTYANFSRNVTSTGANVYSNAFFALYYAPAFIVGKSTNQ